jgi:hypothetical protein
MCMVHVGPQLCTRRLKTEDYAAEAAAGKLAVQGQLYGQYMHTPITPPPQLLQHQHQQQHRQKQPLARRRSAPSDAIIAAAAAKLPGQLQQQQPKPVVPAASLQEHVGCQAASQQQLHQHSRIPHLVSQELQLKLEQQRTKTQRFAQDRR